MKLHEVEGWHGKMTIGSIDCGYRVATKEDMVDNPNRWYSAGVSMAGVTTAFDFGVKEQDIPITFIGLSNTVKDNLKSYLMDTIKPYNTVSVAPDSGDDLGIGASGATNVTFMSFRAEWISYNLWTVYIIFKKYT